MPVRRLIAALACLPLGAAALAAQEFELTVENIMRGPELVGEAPRSFRWTPDSRWLWFEWKQPDVDTAYTVYRVRPGQTPERFEGADLDTIVAGPAVWDRAGRRALYALDGDIVLWDRGTIRRLTRTPGRESRPQWSADERSVYFQQNGNVFAIHLETAELRQLTDIRRGNPPKEDDDETEGQRGLLRRQARQLFEFIASGRHKDQPWNRESEQDTTGPRPFYPGEGKNVTNMQVTPDGRFVLLTINESARNDRDIIMPLWITDDGYLDTYRGRSKVGDRQGKQRAAVLEVETGAATFVGDSIGEGQTEAERDMQGIDVSPNSQYALLRVTSRDREHRWLAVVDLPDLTVREVAHDHDPAWFGFPGPSVQFLNGFLKDGETLYFGSERSGWIHVWTVPVAGGAPGPVTSGEWEVLDAELSRDGETWYLTANLDGFDQVHFYTVGARGGEIRRVTDALGRQDATVSPDGRWLAIRHSSANDPPELYFQENRRGRDMRPVTESTTPAWRSYEWIVPEIVKIRARDGVEVPGRLYRPTGPTSPEGERPAVIFVHGAGYLQNVHNWWSNYYREYMFHHLLAARGYTVLDIDYRGSAGHGRDWRTAIHRHMGGKDLEDQVDAARWLVEHLGVDSTRIGIYGGSYGGFITLMAMFTTPGVFRAGAALRPVTDWAHYNHPYTSAILNEPQDDSTAYVRSSPIFHADGLEGDLLIAHGMVDENVLFYDTARLTQRLIELGKENWETAIYPAERHGFREIASWRDEYRRILKLFERTLR